MYEFLRNKRILVVVAHPDDELLGPGATMHRLIREFGCTIRTVILGEGITSRSDQRDVEKWSTELEIHRKNIHAARKIIGYESVGIHQFADNRFDGVELLDIIKVIEAEKKEFKPEVIFTHHGGDLNVDHQRTFEAVVTSSRPLANEQVKAIITFPTPSGTEWRASTDPRHFIPNLFFEVTEADVKAKTDAMECYDFEKRQFPHPRSPEALEILAKSTGVTVGKKYAEAFCVVRIVS